MKRIIFAYQSRTEADNPNGLIGFGIVVCSPFFRRLAVLNLSAYAFKLLNKRRDFLEDALLLGFVLWIKRTHFRQC
jgi:hypothetical protein